MVSKGIERQGGHQGLQIRVMPTDERKLARGAVHHDIRNPWSQPHNPWRHGDHEQHKNSINKVGIVS